MASKKLPPLVIATRGIVAAAILIVGVVAFVVLARTGPTVPRSDDAAAPPEARVFRVEPVAVQRQWRGYGTAEAAAQADVPARVTAAVASIPEGIDAGVPVEAGQVIVQLDRSDFERQIETAEATLGQLEAQLAQLAVEAERLAERLALEERDVELAREDLARVRQVVARGAGNQQDLDRAERAFLSAERARVQTAEALEQIEPRRRSLLAGIEGQRAAIRLAEQGLERTTIASPIDGVLQALDVEEGENIQAGQRVARVVNLRRIDVPIRLPAVARRGVDVGDAAVVVPSGRPDEACPATVTRVAPETDPQTRTMTVYVTVPQSGVRGEMLLAPGEFVEASVTTGEVVERWVVPRRSIRSGRVFAVREGVVQSVPVTVDYVLEGEQPGFGLPDDQWAVLDGEGLGLRPGDLVLVNASRSVLDGERVAPVLPAATRGVAATGPGGDGGDEGEGATP